VHQKEIERLVEGTNNEIRKITNNNTISNNLEIIKPSCILNSNDDNPNQQQEEYKAMDLEDLLVYIGDPCSNSNHKSNKKIVKNKGKKSGIKDHLNINGSNPQQVSPKNHPIKKKSSSACTTAKQENIESKHRNASKSPNSIEDDILIEDFKSCLRVSTAHSSFVTKESNCISDEWVELLKLNIHK
jgi:hypothetical protein